MRIDAEDPHVAYDGRTAVVDHPLTGDPLTAFDHRSPADEPALPRSGPTAAQAGS
ncbi:hypothetical protein [Streptomyces thermoalcalitolerans]|uniref:Transposase n=1 Tax=Streptomyces thermoalcalitolerans TaxID=65605 RepID=A0ABN1NND0_9ACTN